jgi:hypothetical protein
MPPTSIQAQAYLQGYLQKEASPRLRKWLNQFSDEERLARLDELRKNPAVDDAAMREYFLTYLSAPGHGKSSRAGQWTRGGKVLTKAIKSAPEWDIDDYLVGLHESTGRYSPLMEHVRSTKFVPLRYDVDKTQVIPDRVITEGRQRRVELLNDGFPVDVHIQAAGTTGRHRPNMPDYALDHRLVLDPRGRVSRMSAAVPDVVRDALKDAPRARTTHTRGSGKAKETLAAYPSNKAYNALLEVAADLPTYSMADISSKGFKEVTDPAYLRNALRTGYEQSYGALVDGLAPARLTQRSAEIAPGVFDVRGLDLAGITGNCMGNVCTSKLSAARVLNEGHRIALVVGDGKTPLGIETLQALLGKDTGPEALKRLNDVLATQGVLPKSTYESAMSAIRSSKAVSLIHTDATGNLLDAVTTHNQNISPEAFRRGAAAVGLPSDIDIFKHRVIGGNMAPTAPRKIQDLLKAGKLRLVEEGRPAPIRSLLQQFSQLAYDGESNFPDRWFNYKKPARTDPRLIALPWAQQQARTTALHDKIGDRHINVLGLRKALLRAAATYGKDQMSAEVSDPEGAYTRAKAEIYEQVRDARRKGDVRLASKGGIRPNPHKHAAPLEKVMKRVEDLAYRKARRALMKGRI